MPTLSAGSDKPLPMSVDKVGFLLDRLGQDCAPLQYLRELTQNAIEAIQRVGGEGQITWDVDWTSYDLGGPSAPMRLCIVDTGDPFHESGAADDCYRARRDRIFPLAFQIIRLETAAGSEVV